MIRDAATRPAPEAIMHHPADPEHVLSPDRLVLRRIMGTLVDDDMKRLTL